MSDLIRAPIRTLKEQDKEDKERTSKQPARKKGKDYFRVFAIVLIVISILSSPALLLGGIRAGAAQLMRSFSAAFAEEKESAYQTLYEAAFNQAEQQHHVSNRVQISIGDLQEVQRLEILKANDVEIITEDRDNNTGKVTAWLEVEGEGTFVVDLQAAEYIIDNERMSVLVRIPNPELTNIHIIRSTRRLFSDDFLNGSYSEGVDLRIKQQNEAQLRIENALLSNPYIYSNAKKVSANMIKNLIAQFNPDIPQLIVDVEFFE